MGTWGGERLRRKGVLLARIEALLAVWGQAAWGGDERALSSESLGVKEQALRAFGRFPLMRFVLAGSNQRTVGRGLL